MSKYTHLGSFVGEKYVKKWNLLYSCFTLPSRLFLLTFKYVKLIEELVVIKNYQYTK